jgi:hypothetical protein
MTGPEHYQAAERLLNGQDGAGRRWTDAGWYGLTDRAEVVEYRKMQLAEAAVHRGLAQTAATALQASRTAVESGYQGWTHQLTDIEDWQRAVAGNGAPRVSER